MVQLDKTINNIINVESLQIYCVPDDWKDPATAIVEDEPSFKSIDNPDE